MIPCLKNIESTKIYHCAYKETTKDLYCTIRANWGKLNIINLENKQHNVIDVKATKCVYMQVTDDKIHFFNDHNAHCIGSIAPNNKAFNIFHDTFDYKWKRTYSCSFDHPSVYVPSKSCIVLLGGGDDDIGAFKPFSWKYCLKTEKWSKIKNVLLECYGSKAVLTSNQRYIIVCGGWRKNNHGTASKSDAIYIIDMKNKKWKLRKSKIRSPAKVPCKIVTTGGVDSKGDILVIGYIRECFESKEFEQIQFPPTHIMMLIASFESSEMLHWIKLFDDNNGPAHFGIYLKDIL